MKPPDPRAQGWALAAAVGVIVLVPYATLPLAFRQGLYVQAVVILLAVIALGVWAWAHMGLGGLRDLPRPMLWGLGLYGGAALYGTLVGVFRGNPLEQVAGQWLSMALLPLAALVSLLLPRRISWRGLLHALPAAAAAACLVHLVRWGWAAIEHRPMSRFFLDNNISMDGPALLALLLAVALCGLRKRRLWTVVTLALLVVYLVGSGTRGLWLTSLPATAILFLAARERGPLWKSRLVLSLAGAAVLLVALIAGLLAWSAAERPNLLNQAPRLEARPKPGMPRVVVQPDGGFVIRWQPTPGFHPVLGPIALTEPGAYRLSAEIRGSGPERGGLVIQGFDAAGTEIAVGSISVPSPSQWHRRAAVVALPATVTTVQIVVNGSRSQYNRWAAREVRLERLGPAAAATALAQLSYLDWRLRTLASLGDLEAAAQRDTSLQLRVRESKTLFELVERAPLARKLLGHGLGATYVMSKPAAGEQGLKTVNYIHNFYAFLLFKLGVVGGLGVLAALGIFGVQAWRKARRADGEERWLLAAAAGTWPAYVVLAISSPEILNFRAAPLLGFLVAAMVAASSAPGSPKSPA